LFFLAIEEAFETRRLFFFSNESEGEVLLANVVNEKKKERVVFF